MLWESRNCLSDAVPQSGHLQMSISHLEPPTWVRSCLYLLPKPRRLLIPRGPQGGQVEQLSPFPPLMSEL